MDASDNLSRLFAPRSIAVYGASADPKKIGGRVLAYLKSTGFSGPIYPINPGRGTVQDLVAYPTVAAVPEPVDLVIIVVPVEACLAAFEDCAEKGVAGALIMSSGFSEMGAEGAELQNRIARIARDRGIRVLGPNCVGFVNARHNVSATFSPVREHSWPDLGPIGFASQSGAFGSHCAAVMRQRGMGLGTWITTGNEADVDIADAIGFLAGDDSIRVIAAYMEGSRDAGKLSRALELARARGKPVILLKVGTTEVGAAAAASHTASLAGRDELFDAYFHHHGVTRVGTIEELLDTAYACAGAPAPRSARTVIVSTSGGVGILMGDAAIESGLEVNALPEETQEAIRTLLPYAGVRNPIDTTAQVVADISTFYACFDLAAAGAGADIIVAHLSHLGHDAAMMDRLSEPFFALRRKYPDRLFAISMLCPPERRRTFEDAGFLVFEDPTRAIRAAARAWSAARSLQRTSASNAASAPAASASPISVRTEAEAKRFVASAGIPVPEERLARTAAEAAEIAAAIGGPLVMKIVSPQIAHKTEVGGVVLGVEGGADAARVYDEITARVAAARPAATIEGVLVGRMIRGGIETIAGVVNDPVLGPFVMFGLGGIYAEIMNDVAFRAAPFGTAVAREMIDELRASAILKGARGQAAADLDALAAVLSRLSELAAVHAGWIESIDINPLIINSDGIFAVDALVVPLRS